MVGMQIRFRALTDSTYATSAAASNAVFDQGVPCFHRRRNSNMKANQKKSLCCHEAERGAERQAHAGQEPDEKTERKVSLTMAAGPPSHRRSFYAWRTHDGWTFRHLAPRWLSCLPAHWHDQTSTATSTETSTPSHGLYDGHRDEVYDEKGEARRDSTERVPEIELGSAPRTASIVIGHGHSRHQVTLRLSGVPKAPS